MWPLLLTFVRSYAPYITLPVAAVIGLVGYKVENMISDKYTPFEKSIEEKREERLLEENLTKDVTQLDSLKKKTFIKQRVLERNLSPSLLEEK